MTVIQAAQWLQFDDFLSPESHDRLLHYVRDRAADFVGTSTSTGAIDYRKSWILYEFAEIDRWMMQQVEAMLPIVLQKLDQPDFTPSQIEIQLTAHNDGNYYKIHNDNGSPEVIDRTLSYVYYFYREPKAFMGGELRIYDLDTTTGFYEAANTAVTIEPRNNSIVFFPSHYLHEVLPVVCPSRQFHDSRFTLNGWVRR